MKKVVKETVVVATAIWMLMFGCGMTIAAFCIEPVGEVSDSVLWILGQSLIYAGSALAIGQYAKATVKEEVGKMMHNKHDIEGDVEKIIHEDEPDEE